MSPALACFSPRYRQEATDRISSAGKDRRQSSAPVAIDERFRAIRERFALTRTRLSYSPTIAGRGHPNTSYRGGYTSVYRPAVNLE